MTPVIKEEQMTTLEKKIQNFSRILASRPSDELTVLALAEASFRRGLKLEALTAYQEIGSRAVPEAHLAVAEIYSDQGMPHEAYGELRRLFELDSENVEARLLIHTLQAEVLPPEDLREVLNSPISEAAIDEAKLRLKIQRSIYHRELQERTRNVTLEPGTVIHEYHMEEAKKKLIRVDELLRELDRFREYNTTLSAPPRPEAVSAQAEPSEEAQAEPAAEELLTLEAPSEGKSGVSAEDIPPGLDELPIEILEDVAPTFSVSVEASSESTDVPAMEQVDLRVEPLVTESTLGVEMAPLSLAAVEEPPVGSYSSGEFDLSVESPLAPDLPDLGVEEESPSIAAVPSMIDLEPIDMNRDTPDVISMDMPRPTFRDAPSPPEPASVSALMPIMDDSTMILTPSEPDVSPSAVDEPSESPVPESTSVAPEGTPPAPETAPASGEVDAPLDLSSARKSFYQTHAEALSGLTTTLARTRGVTSIFLVAREGVTIDAVAKDEISQERVGELVRESFEFLEAFAKDPAYWVLECAGGIFVMQKLDDRHVLIAIGQAGANFGALRFTMDKTRTKFEQLLAQVPE